MSQVFLSFGTYDTFSMTLSSSVFIQIQRIRLSFRSIICCEKLKVNFTLEQSMKAQRENMRYRITLSLTMSLDGDGWSAPRPSRFTHINYLVLIAQEAVWDPGPVRTGPEKLAAPGFDPPDRPAPSELLHELRLLYIFYFS